MLSPELFVTLQLKKRFEAKHLKVSGDLRRPSHKLDASKSYMWLRNPKRLS